MYIDKNTNILYKEKQPYTTASGVKYPGNYPKDEIPELVQVQDDGPTIPSGKRVASKTVQWDGDVPKFVYTYEDIPQDDIDAAKAQANQFVDARAEQERLKYITPGSGQAMVYEEKYNEAVEYQAAQSPDIDDYPHIKAEIGTTAADAAGVVAIIIARRNFWKQVSAEIEGARLKAKADIAAASTIEAINQIKDDYEQGFAG